MLEGHLLMSRKELIRKSLFDRVKRKELRLTEASELLEGRAPIGKAATPDTRPPFSLTVKHSFLLRILIIHRIRLFSNRNRLMIDNMRFRGMAFGVCNLAVRHRGYFESPGPQQILNFFFVVLVDADVLMDFTPSAADLATQPQDGHHRIPIKDFDHL